ncbi:MAG: hypothetical protein JWN46_891 [Acidimicrobiales bacterium]|nr:hypothetical protein [Acidimicrobiales bacterium]
MSRATRSANVGLGELLAELPSPFVTCAVDDGWLVAGPPGVYLVMQSTPDCRGLREADLLASRVRVTLAHHLTLAPYVHPLLVAERPTARPGGSVVRRDMLRDVLIHGLTLVDPVTLARIRELAASGELAGGPTVRDGARGWAGAPSLH